MKHKLTQQDVDKMKAEIEHRKVEVRPELLEHVKEATWRFKRKLRIPRCQKRKKQKRKPNPLP